MLVAGSTAPMFASRPRLIVLFVAFAVGAYILCVGPTIFWIESFGTLMLSPAVYINLSPPWLAYPLAHSLRAYPVLHILICGIPVAMLAAGIALGAVGFQRNSLRLALVASALVTTVFGVYHFVQPMGFRVLN